MAQAAFSMDKAQFSCSICLELLRDPVTIPCGHSYCMSCLTDYWDRQRVCSCPQCRATFNPRPKLGRNTLLAEMLQKLSAVKLSEGPSAPPFYEVLGPAEAQGLEHATFKVSSVRPERTDGERLLGEKRRQLSAQLKESGSQLQQLKQNLRSFSGLAKTAVKDSSRIFSELVEFLERCRVEMKDFIRAHEKAEVTRAENHLRHLEWQISELRRRDNELEKLSHSQDQNLITQICQSFHSLPRVEANSSLTISAHVSFGPVRKAISDLKEQLQHLYHTEFPSITAAVKTVNLLELKTTSKAIEASSSATISTFLDSRNDLLQYFCPLSLDPFTAHRELSLTEGNCMVIRTGEIQCYPDHPDRFDTWGQALCREGLQGRHYWEAEWNGREVAVGLAYESIRRKVLTWSLWSNNLALYLCLLVLTLKSKVFWIKFYPLLLTPQGSSDECRLGHNTLSWSLHCNSSSFTFRHGKQSVAVANPCSSVSCRIGVFLDHNAGLLCFYSVTPTDVHLLHRVEVKFREPLYPAVWLGSMSAITFCTIDCSF